MFKMLSAYVKNEPERIHFVFFPAAKHFRFGVSFKAKSRSIAYAVQTERVA